MSNVEDWGPDEDPMRKVVDLSHWLYFFMPEENRAKLDEWMTYGKCFAKGHLNEVFNPPIDEEDGPTARVITVEAKKYCNGDVDGMRCSMRERCLDYAITNKVYYGVWGGATVRERRRIASMRVKK